MGSLARAESLNANSQARVIFETDLKEKPRESANSIGRLPDGSIVTIIGKQRGDYQLVEVELEDETQLEGWINENALQVLSEDRGEEEKVLRPKRRRKKIRVPKDEGILLRREPSFFFGGALGGTYSFILPVQVPGTELTYTGLGLQAGAFVGLFATEKIPVRFEVNYVQFGGANPDDPAVVQYGFVELGVVPSVIFGSFEFFAGLQYAIGISIAQDPSNFIPQEPINGPTDLSSLGGQVGVGYLYLLNKGTYLGIKIRYNIHFANAPILRSQVGFFASIRVQG